MNTVMSEGARAVLCSIWAGRGRPVRNPALMKGMHAVCWSTSEAGARKLADAVVRAGLAEGDDTHGYLLTEAGLAEII
jgi:hypothetical protein